MQRDLEHRSARVTDTEEDLETPMVRWPDPSPLQSWWNQVMNAGSAGNSATGRPRGQHARRLRPG